MAGLQRVRWRHAGSALLTCALVAGGVFTVLRRDGVRPSSLKSRTATHWLVHRSSDGAADLVLADGLTSRVIARINPQADTDEQVAVEGPAGAFLLTPGKGTVRTIATASLQLGTPQLVTTLAVPGAKFGVGTAGLTVVAGDAAEVVAANDVSRPVEIPPSSSSLIASDGSMWFFGDGTATHVGVDETRTEIALAATPVLADVTTVGAEAVWFDRQRSRVLWLSSGRDISLSGVTGAAAAVIQRPNDEPGAVWLAVGDQLLRVTRSGVERQQVPGLGVTAGDALAVAGKSAAVIRGGSQRIDRIDLDGEQMVVGEAPQTPATSLTINASSGLVWIDETDGDTAWAVNPHDLVRIDKADTRAPLFDASGRVDSGGGSSSESGDNGDGGDEGSTETDREDPHPGLDDPPIANPDSVTARAGATITIPVTANDFDPEGDAIAMVSVDRAGHGTSSNLDGASVGYQPEAGFSGIDEFQYRITDEAGHEAVGTVRLRIFAPDSPNQPPLTQPDVVETRAGSSVTIDVLANDVDPERDPLSIPTFQQVPGATITDGVSLNGLVALQFDPPADARPGQELTFTYVAADPQGGVSQPTPVTVRIISPSAANRPPVANPDAARIAIGNTSVVQVLVNDTDADYDTLSVSLPGAPPAGVTVSVRNNALVIGLEPGAVPRSVVRYALSDGVNTPVTGRVLVLRADDAELNRPPIANPDVERVVVGNSVVVPVVRNDRDPDGDPIRLVSVRQPAEGSGKTEVVGDSVRFTPNLPDITQPTNVDFQYEIDDGHGNQATGTVTITVLSNALPRAPFARDDAATTEVNKPVTIDVLANDSDPSGGQPSLFDDPTCVAGSAVRTNEDRVVYTPPADQVGTFRCRYSVVNAQQLRRQASIVITVVPVALVNSAPRLVLSALSVTIAPGRTLVLSVNDVATDDEQDALTFTRVGKSGQGATTSLNGSGTLLTYTAPLTTSTVVDSVPIGVFDGTSTTRGQLSVTVRPEPPTAVAPRAVDLGGSTKLDTRRTFNVLGQVSDANPGMTVLLLSASLTSGAATVDVNQRAGLVSILPTGPDTVVVRYRIANASEPQLTAEGTITLTVILPPPLVDSVAVADSVQLTVGDTLTVDLVANDSINLDPGEQLTATLEQTLPVAVGSSTLSSDGTRFAVHAEPDATPGVYNLSYAIDDGGSRSRAPIKVTVLACGEQAPAAVVRTGFTPYQQPYQFDLTAGLPAGQFVVPDSVSGGGLTGPIGVYTPPAGMNDNVVVSYRVSNHCGQTAPGVFTLDVNHSPRVTGVSREVAPGSAITIPIADIAADDEPLQVDLDGAPSWVSLTAEGVRAAPPAGTPRSPYGFGLIVTDPGGLSTAATITITVTNRAPVANSDHYDTELDVFTFDPTWNDGDPDGDAITISDVSWVSGSGSISINGPLVTVQVPHGASELTYTIDDGDLSATARVTIFSNHAPTVGDESKSTNDGTATVRLHPHDPDGDVMVVSCNSSANLFVEVDVFRLSVTVLNAFIGTESFQCTVTDAFGATATATVTIESIEASEVITP